MKIRIKRMAVIIGVTLLLIMALPGQVTGKSCSCYSLEAAKNVCWTQNEYVDSNLISGYCEGPSCYAYVEVICKDLDNKGEIYKRNRYIWGNNCAACISTSGGGGGDGAGFDDIDGDYGNWHDPNWR